MDVERFTTLAREGLALILNDRLHEAVPLLTEADGLFEEGDQAAWATSADRELRSLHHRVMEVLATAAVAREDHDAAIRYLLRCVEGNSEGSGSFYDLARTAAAARRHGEARRYYRIYRERSKKLQADAKPFPGPGRV